MSDEINFNYNINSTWSIVKTLREKVESLLADKSQDLAYACKMTASELVENAVKYGCSIDQEKGIVFNFVLNKGEARIEVANGIVNISDYENVKKHINDINHSDNPHELYLKRLEILMSQKKAKQSQLGLYRIAYEGEFTLQYNYDEDKRVLTVIAIKGIKDL